jgi:hypothetical protein
MKKEHILLLVVFASLLAAILVDRLYVSKFKKKFITLEKQRIVISNKLATAKIVHENLNHVRDLVFKNMDFAGQKNPGAHETHFFNFITTCINDLKLKLVSVKPVRPKTEGLVTTYGYEIEIEGDFFKFGELCSKFENSRRIASVEEYEVRLIDQDEDSGQGSRNKLVYVRMRVNTVRVKKS